MKKTVLSTLFIGFLSMASLPCDAMHLYLTLDRIVQKADVIFLGKVVDQASRHGPNGKMIFTDVYFDVLRLIYKSERSQPIAGNNIMLTFAGGNAGGKIVKVSDVPSFETGATYLIFTLMDGKTYASPIIGGFQGLFRVITDEVSGTDYALTYGKQGITEIRDGDIVTSPPVSKIKEGIIEKLPEKTAARFYDVAPKPAEWMDQTKVRASVSHMATEIPEKMITLDKFIEAIEETINRERGENK